MEGYQCWQLLLDCASQLHVTAMGDVIGLDLATAMEMADALCLSKRAMALLLPAAAAGMTQGYSKLKDNGDHEPSGE